MLRDSTFVKWTIYFLFGIITLWGISQVVGYIFMIKWGFDEVKHDKIEVLKQDETEFAQKINALIVNENYDIAILLINNRVLTNPEKITSLFQDLGSIYYIKGDLDSAIICFSKAIGSSDFYPDGYANRGFIYEKQGKLQFAIQDYEIAANDHPVYNYEFGLALEKDEQIQAAYRAYLDYLEYDSSDATILRKVDSLEHSGITLEAEKEYISWDDFKNN